MKRAAMAMSPSDGASGTCGSSATLALGVVGRPDVGELSLRLAGQGALGLDVAGGRVRARRARAAGVAAVEDRRDVVHLPQRAVVVLVVVGVAAVARQAFGPHRDRLGAARID